jgi:hypothetical protein
MAVAFIMDFAGGTTEHYDAVLEKMGLGDRLPAGALFHAAGVNDNGLQVCDVWESAEVFQRFAEGQIQPITQEVGLPATASSTTGARRPPATSSCRPRSAPQLRPPGSPPSPRSRSSPSTTRSPRRRPPACETCDHAKLAADRAKDIRVAA